MIGTTTDGKKYLLAVAPGMWHAEAPDGEMYCIEREGSGFQVTRFVWDEAAHDGQGDWETEACDMTLDCLATLCGFDGLGEGRPVHVRQ